LELLFFSPEPLTLQNLRSRLPSLNIPLPGRNPSSRSSGGSFLSGTSRPFGFARFTNERISSVNISGGPSLPPNDEDKKNENLDENPPIEAIVPVSSTSFENVGYDLLGGTSSFDPLMVKNEENKGNMDPNIYEDVIEVGKQWDLAIHE